MTRFARAKGSKASNERVPEEATSWATMKQQLLEKDGKIEEEKNRNEMIIRRNNNYKAFLTQKEEDENKHSKWADFPSVTKTLRTNSGIKKKRDHVKLKVVLNNNLEELKISNGELFSQLKSHSGKLLDESNNNKSDSDAPPDEISSKQEVPTPKLNKKKKKIKKLKILADSSTEKVKQKYDTNIDKNVESIQIGKKNVKKSKNKVKVERNEPDKIKTEADLKKIEKKKQKRIKQLEKKKKKKAELKRINEAKLGKETDNMSSEGNKIKTIDAGKNKGLALNNRIFPHKSSHMNETTKKQSKNRDNKEHPRKKPFLPHKMFINGKEIEIDYVEGFPVKKEDAVRLKKLRKEMIIKGLPRSEINIALKLERRKAEKAFAREKKKVCFNCRKSGHNLSECPELNKNQVAATAGSGICFKCGSTEHTHFECKVVIGQNFNYAQCFICNEQGHIARQCPDNPRGLYPKGGGCKVCGDVTHLKKDCPKYQAEQQKQEDKFKIEISGNSNPDALEENLGNMMKPTNKRENKIIKF